MNPVQGGFISAPLASPPIGANNNNNKQAPALPGPSANPTPGTVVVHFNGFAVAEFQSMYTSTDRRIAAPITGVNVGLPNGNIPGGSAQNLSTAVPNLQGVLGANVVGPVKLMPQAIDAYGRLFAGVDAMAANGLRYGAGLEIRENQGSQPSSTTSSGASGYTYLQTLFVRRAFTYIAGEDWGIVRLGQADGLISLFDSGVTTFQFLPSGNLNGGDGQNMPGTTPPFVFVGVSGNEYDNAKAVYLSPQIAGFDFGIQYAPNTTNGANISQANMAYNTVLSGSGIGTGAGTCAVANSTCPTLSSGPGIFDGSRAINQWAIGARYQGILGGAGVLAYVVGEFSGHSDYTGGFAAINASNPTAASLSNPITGLNTAAGGGFSQSLTVGGVSQSKFNGQFKGLAIGSAGLAVTFAGITVGGNVIGGNMNGQLGLTPQNGAPLFGYLLGAKYITYQSVI
jgi:hypothetical protein